MVYVVTEHGMFECDETQGGLDTQTHIVAQLADMLVFLSQKEDVNEFADYLSRIARQCERDVDNLTNDYRDDFGQILERMVTVFAREDLTDAEKLLKIRDDLQESYNKIDDYEKSKQS